MGYLERQWFSQVHPGTKNQTLSSNLLFPLLSVSVSSSVKLFTMVAALQRCLLMSHTALHWIWAGLCNQQGRPPDCGRWHRKCCRSHPGLREHVVGRPEPPCEKVRRSWDCHARRKPMLALWRGCWERDREKEMRRKRRERVWASVHAHVARLQLCQPCQPRARPESEESISVVQVVTPLDDSSPCHHQTATT